MQDKAHLQRTTEQNMLQLLYLRAEQRAQSIRIRQIQPRFGRKSLNILPRCKLVAIIVRYNVVGSSFFHGDQRAKLMTQLNLPWKLVGSSVSNVYAIALCDSIIIRRPANNASWADSIFCHLSEVTGFNWIIAFSMCFWQQTSSYSVLTGDNVAEVGQWCQENELDSGRV